MQQAKVIRGNAVELTLLAAGAVGDDTDHVVADGGLSV
jgi:hypothetical protein